MSFNLVLPTSLLLDKMNGLSHNFLAKNHRKDCIKHNRQILVYVIIGQIIVQYFQLCISVVCTSSLFKRIILYKNVQRKTCRITYNVYPNPCGTVKSKTIETIDPLQQARHPDTA